MKHALIIDIQNTKTESFPNGNKKHYLEKISKEKIPVYIALTPYQRSQWQDLEKEIGGIIENEGCNLLLEGLLHTCSQKNHTIRDPHHEHICTSWFQKSAPYSMQVENIQEGIEFLKRIFGARPIGYVPPQHLHNKDTIKAVRNSDLPYLITNAMFEHMNPYNEDGVIIVPSGSLKHGRVNTPVVHVYYDKIFTDVNKFSEILQTIAPLSEIQIGGRCLVHRLNDRYIALAKQLRDGKRLINWAMDKSARNRIDSETLRKNRLEQYEEQKEKLFGSQIARM